MATLQQIYDELIAQGATPTQAAGIAGNAQFETSGNTQFYRPDCMGIVCWSKIEDDGQVVTGIQLRRRLTPQDYRALI